MNSLTHSLFLFLFLFLLPWPSSSQSAPSSEPSSIPSSAILRTTKQQILASLPPTSNPQPFLTCPSGKYAASLVRSPSSPTSGFGNDFCTIQITMSNDPSIILWESECAPVSNVNTCTLVFDDAGLEVFDGAQSVYNTQADGNHVNTLELLDQGDMRIIDKDGELSWKATDEPRGYQGCGFPGSVGMAPDSPPFAGLIGGGGSGSKGPFGRPAAVGGQLGPAAAVTASGGGEEVGVGGEMPLMDHSPFDSGSWKGMVCTWFIGVGLVAVALIGI